MSMRLQWFTHFPSAPAAVGVDRGAIVGSPVPASGQWVRDRLAGADAEPSFECTACGFATCDADDMLEHMRREGARRIEMSPVR